MGTYRADFRANTDALTALAGDLDEAAGQARAAAEAVAGAAAGAAAGAVAGGWDGEYGPDGLAEAVGELTGVWQGRLLGIHRDVATAATQVRAARDAYLDADAAAAAEFERGG
ncbi:MAG TPA: hypothetical protein VFM37_04810 [Pseudonocardiaceae bacterium]|nr:hypothetical protein [Pseudonocardiaceae bacterium]